MSFKNRKRHSVFYEEEQNKEGREEGSRGREGEGEGIRRDGRKRTRGMKEGREREFTKHLL